MKIALYTRSIKSKHLEYIHSLFAFLKKEGIEVIISPNLIDSDSKKIHQAVFSNNQEIVELNPDLVVSLGGDGTILDTVVLTHNTQIPVLGVNLGRLGFLSAVNPDDSFAAIKSFNHRKVNIEKRMLLEVNGQPEIFKGQNVALNDLTFLRVNTSSMIEVTVFIEDELLNTYFADGLIVSTSTGSTGYSLSCGGPVIHPQTDSFILTPIAPHNLNVRPIVIPPDVNLRFEIKGRTPDFLCTLDSRLTHIGPLNKISVKKSDQYFYLYQPKPNNFIEALKNKLFWGKQNFS